jgi:hypothetical protein
MAVSLLTAWIDCVILKISFMKEVFYGLQTQRSCLRHNEKDCRKSDAEDQEKIRESAGSIWKKDGLRKPSFFVKDRKDRHKELSLL